VRTGRGREGRRGERERGRDGEGTRQGRPPKLKLGPTRTIFLAPALSVTGHRN